MTWLRLAFLALAGAVLAAMGFLLLPVSPPVQALAAYLAAGTARADHCWLDRVPSRNGGVYPFDELGPVAWAPPVIIDGGDIAEPLSILGGLDWDAAREAWVAPSPARPGPQPLRRLVTRGELRASLATATGGELQADALLDLLIGPSAAGAPSFGRRLLVDGICPRRIILHPFAGQSGLLRIPNGRGTVTTTQPFAGCVLAYDDPSWPDRPRLLWLKPVEETR